MGFFIRWRNWVISICNIPVFCLSFFFSVLSNTQTHLHVLPGWLVQLLAWPTYRGRKLLKGTDVGWSKRQRKEAEVEEEEEEKQKNVEEEEKVLTNSHDGIRGTVQSSTNRPSVGIICLLADALYSSTFFINLRNKCGSHHRHVVFTTYAKFLFAMD